MCQIPLVDEALQEQAANDPEFLKSVLGVGLYLHTVAQMKELVARAIKASELPEPEAIAALARQIDPANVERYTWVIDGILGKNTDPNLLDLFVVASHLGWLLRIEVVEATPAIIEELAQTLH